MLAWFELVRIHFKMNITILKIEIKNKNAIKSILHTFCHIFFSGLNHKSNNEIRERKFDVIGMAQC